MKSIADALAVLAGSSYGGLAASIVAMRMPDAFRGLLLCAPALHLHEPPIDAQTILVAPKGLKTAIIHGIDDDIVPISCSIEYAELIWKRHRSVSSSERWASFSSFSRGDN